MRPLAQSTRTLAVVLAAVIPLLAIGCASGRRPGSYLPVGARAWYGDATNDGLVVLLRGKTDAITRRVEQALRTAGYAVEPRAESGRTVRTVPRALGGDTALVVTAEVTPYDAPGPAASVVLTGTYTAPSGGARRAPVLQRRGEVNPLFARLRAVADTLRTAPSAAR